MISRTFVVVVLSLFAGCTCGRATEERPAEGNAALSAAAPTPPPSGSAEQAATGKAVAKHATTGGMSSCGRGQNCTWTCPSGSCVQICAGGSNCNASCEGGGCKQTCASNATCAFTCEGGSCRQSCGTGTCSKSCGGPGGCS